MSSSSARTGRSGLWIGVLRFFRALRAVWFPSSVGMFVYMFVTSTVHRSMSLSNVLFSNVWMRYVVSLSRWVVACLSQ